MLKTLREQSQAIAKSAIAKRRGGMDAHILRVMREAGWRETGMSLERRGERKKRNDE